MHIADTESNQSEKNQHFLFLVLNPFPPERFRIWNFLKLHFSEFPSTYTLCICCSIKVETFYWKLMRNLISYYSKNLKNLDLKLFTMAGPRFPLSASNKKVRNRSEMYHFNGKSLTIVAFTFQKFQIFTFFSSGSQLASAFSLRQNVLSFWAMARKCASDMAFAEL